MAWRLNRATDQCRSGFRATRLASSPRLWPMTDKPIRGHGGRGVRRLAVSTPLPLHGLMPSLVASRLIAAEAALCPLGCPHVSAGGLLDLLWRMGCSGKYFTSGVVRSL